MHQYHLGAFEIEDPAPPEVLTDAAMEARLRRACEKKPSGKIYCPEWMHKQWLDKSNRADMKAAFAAAGWNKVGVPIKERSFIPCSPIG